MTQNNDALKVARGTSFLIMKNMGSAIIQTLTFAIIARILTQAEMGILDILFLVLTFLNIISNIGLTKGNSKFISELIGRGRREEAANICYQTLRFNIVTSIILGSVCFIFSDRISLLLLKSLNYSILFKILSFNVVAVSIHISLMSSVMGLQKFKEASIFNLIRLIVRQVLIVFSLLSGHGLIGIAVAWLIGDLLNCSMFGVLVFKSFGRPSFDFNLKTLLKFSLPLYFQDIFQFIYGWFDRAILLAFFSLDNLGIYSVSYKPFQALSSFTESMKTTLFPKYSELHGRNGKKSLENAILIASRYASLIMVPLAFGLLALAGPAISILAGSSYSMAIQPLALFCFFMGVTSIGTGLSGVLLILDKTMTASILNVLSAIIGTILGLILSTLLGVNGIAAAKGISWIITVLMFLWILKKNINLKLDKEAFFKSLVSGATMSTVLIIIQIFYYHVYLLPLYVGGGALIYITMLKVTKAVKERDVELVKLYVGKRLEFMIKPFEVFLLTKS